MRCYRQILKLDGANPIAHNNLGLALQACGRVDEAAACFENAIASKRDYVEAHNNLGIILTGKGDYEAAVASYEQAVAINPQYVDAISNMGIAYAEWGKGADAIRCHQRAIAIKPDHINSLNNLGMALTDLERFDEAAIHLQKALALNPGFPEARYNLGIVMNAQGKYAEALACYREAINQKPDYTEAYANLGACLHVMGRLEEAVACYQKLLTIKPEHVEALNSLGNIMVDAGDHDGAIGYYERAIRIKPDFMPAHSNLGTALTLQGRMDAATACFERAIAVKPSLELAIKKALCQLPIQPSTAAITEFRASLEQELHRLSGAEPSHADPVTAVGLVNYYTAYHGANDRTLQKMLAGLFADKYPHLAWRAPHSGRARRQGGLINVGFFSSHLYNHTIGHLNRGIIANLDRKRFEVVVIRPPSPQDEWSAAIDKSADRVVAVPRELPAAREIIAEEKLDILFYLDIGMCPFTYFLAFARLAPVQCVTWGHPVTTGIPDIDYFITSKLLETPAVQEHYSEEAVLLQSLPTFYYRPETPDKRYSRGDFGLPEDANIYLCPQSLYKIHPDFDAAIMDILRRDPKGLVVFIAGKHQYWTRLLRERWRHSAEMLIQRTIFLPHMDEKKFIGLMQLGDVIIDPFHFSGGKTTSEALGLGQPVVTMPGEFMRSRVTLACYRQMGMMDLVAENVQEYVSLALRLATDPVWRAEMVAKIHKLSPLLFEDMAAIREFEEFFSNAVAKTQGSETIAAVDANRSEECLQQATALHQAGRFAAALKPYAEAIRHDPQNHIAHSNMGLALHALERLDEAVASFKAAIAIKGDFADAHNNLGVTLKKRGDLDAALGSYRQAVAINPDYAAAHHNLGSLLQVMGEPDEAVAAYKRAVELNGNLVEAHASLGALLMEQDRVSAAVPYLEQAIAINPTHADAHYHLGRAMKLEYRLDDALEHLHKAIAAWPDFVAAINNVGNILIEKNRLDEADRYLHRALDINPQFAPAHYNLGMSLTAQSRATEGRESFKKAMAIDPSLELELKIAMSQPIIAAAKEEIIEFRAHLDQELDRLQAQPISHGDPYKQGGDSNFFTAYHGLDDLSLQRRLAAFYKAKFSMLSWQPQPSAPRRDSDARIKIGILSSHMHDHTIGSLNLGIVENLNKDQFSIVIFRPKNREDDISRRIDAAADNVVPITKDLAATREIVAKENLDILYYPDIGMCPFTYFMAFYRLAPVQCVTWGHPVTTGIPNIDYFFSSSALETENAEQHYSEKLFLSNRLPGFYLWPKLPDIKPNRKDFFLPESGNIYLCPQSLFKIHPDFDSAVMAVLDGDQDGHVVFIEGYHPNWGKRLRQRMGRLSEENAKRIIFIPRIEQNRFAALFHVADVVLDPFHFSGGKTTSEALAAAAPIVTMPGPYMRSRVTLGCYRLMGMEELVAGSVKEYVDLALRLTGDALWREAIIEKIRKSAPLIFEDMAAVREFERFFVTVAKGSKGSKKPKAAPQESHANQVAKLLAKAVALHQSGQAAPALEAYRHILTLDPDNHAVLSNMGLLLQAQGDHKGAIDNYNRAIAANPDHAGAYNNLGNALRVSGQMDAAIASYRRAIAIDADHGDAWFNLGNALHSQKKRDAAAYCFEKLLDIDPNHAVGCNNLGYILHQQGELATAETLFKKAVSINPGYGSAICNLGNILCDQDKYDQAIQSYQTALDIAPNDPETLLNLGNALQNTGRFDEAISALRKALAIDANLAGAHINLGIIYQKHGGLDAAIKCYRQACACEPGNVAALSNLGNALQERGRLEEGVATLQQALELDPENAAAHHNIGNLFKDIGLLEDANRHLRLAIEKIPAAWHNLLMTAQYIPQQSAENLFKLHKQWSASLQIDPTAIFDHDRAPHPGGKLRIGLVSADFGHHPIGYFTAGFLARRPPDRVTTICYSDRIADDWTRRLQTLADEWVETRTLDDSRLGMKIYADRIDILFDMSGHTAKNRLAMLALQPAPIQISWAGYVGTTGLATMDGLIADQHYVPVGEDRFYTERIIRLPDSWVSYTPPDYDGLHIKSRSKRDTAENFTMGNCGNPAKINPDMIRLWARIMQRLPHATLRLTYKSMDDPANVRRITAAFAEHGIAANRIVCDGFRQHRDFLAGYNAIDLALDTLPYSGGLTTLESLWMGVPVVTMRGGTFAGRHATSILHATGLEELVADDAKGYEELVVALAEDGQRLKNISANLRERLLASPICDHDKFAHDMIAALEGFQREIRAK